MGNRRENVHHMICLHATKKSSCEKKSTWKGHGHGGIVQSKHCYKTVTHGDLSEWLCRAKICLFSHKKGHLRHPPLLILLIKVCCLHDNLDFNISNDRLPKKLRGASTFSALCSKSPGSKMFLFSYSTLRYFYIIQNRTKIISY